MLESNWNISIGRLFNLVSFDLIVGLLLAWLIVEDPRRWPILLVLIPLLLYVNAVLVRRAVMRRKTISYALPAIYFCGLVYGIGWTIAGFTWWKLISLAVPLVLFINSLRRRRLMQMRTKLPAI